MKTVKTKVKAGQYLLQNSKSPLTGEALKVGRTWFLSIGNIQEQFKTLKEAIAFFEYNCSCVELPKMEEYTTVSKGIKLPSFTLAEYRQALINNGFISKRKDDVKTINLFIPIFIFICFFVCVLVGSFGCLDIDSIVTGSLSSLITDKYNNISSFFPVSL